MKILKPTWVGHSGFPIFSIDVHPDGSRFATGGGDNKIKIWSVAPVVVKEADEDESVPKLLKTIESHYSPVNSVKWSKDGKYLASGSDDRLVMIWGLSKYGSVGSMGQEKTVENWINVATLRGHEADISEVAWSYDGKFLASCSVDTTIRIWECSRDFRLIATLKEHKGFVKGICWDPIGRYIASQSDDRSVIIWRTSDWQVETTITEPFDQQVSSFFLRPSWSPDGQTLCATSGSTTKQSQTAAIIYRQGWKLACSFIGHTRPIVVARYSPIIYKDVQSGETRNLILLGAQDDTLTLWSNSSPRPIVIVRSLFEQNLQDFSWSPDGMSFFCCSTEGSIAYISLSTEELSSVPMTTADKTALMRRTYGEAVTVSKDGTIISNSVGMAGDMSDKLSTSFLAENPDQLAAEDSATTSPTNESINGVNDNAAPIQIQIQPTQVAMSKQTQTVVNGRRRITPLNLGGVSNGTQSITKPQPVAIPSHIQMSDDSISSPLRNSSSSSSMDIDNNNNNLTSTSTSSTSKQNGHSHSHSSSHSEKERDKTTPTKDKEREKEKEKEKDTNRPPATIPEMEKILSKRRQQDDSQPNSSSSTSTSSHSSKRQKPKSNPTPSTPSSSSSSTSTNLSKDKSTDKNNMVSSGNIHQSGGGMNGVHHHQSLYIQPPQSGDHIIKQLTNNINSSSSSPFDTTTTTTTNTLNNNNNNNGISSFAIPSTPNIYLDVKVSSQELSDGTEEYFSTIRCISDATLVWENRINGKVTLATGNKSWTAVVTSDAVTHIYNKNGTSLMTNIVLREQGAFLESNKSDHLMLITCDGCVSVWNIPRKKCDLLYIHPPYLSNRDKHTIKYAFITDQGKPIITISNGDSYVYSGDIGNWAKITDRLGSLSEFNNTNDSSSGILSKLQQNTKPPSMTSMLTLTSTEQSNQAQNTTSYLERQIYLSILLESSNEYKRWLMIFARFLINNESVTRLQDLCNELLGPSAQPGESSNWQPQILGLSKRDLLKEILQVMTGNRVLQRIVTQYKESLQQFTSNNPFDILFSINNSQTTTDIRETLKRKE